MSVFRVFALVIALILTACLPDEPRYSVTYRDRDALAGGRAVLKSCLPLSTRQIVVDHDRLRGTERGTFAFQPGDESLAQLIERSELPFGSRAARQWTSDGWPFASSREESPALRIYRCEQARFLIAVNEATGEVYFRERR